MPATVRRAANPRPIQFTPFRKEQFASDEGIAFFNQTLAQIINALNRNTGQAGPVVLPAGLDVAGGSVTGLAPPSDPSDAVSLAHSNSNYGAPAVGAQLDIGGANTLKGLSGIYLAMTQAFTGTIIIPKLSIANGSITVVNGLITAVVQPT